MSQPHLRTLVFWAVAWLSLAGESGRVSASEPDTPPDGSPHVVAAARDNWVAGAPRDEIRPEFAHQPTAGRMAGVASSSRPITARASTATGRRISRSPGASPITSGRFTRPRGSPCRGGASWPRSAGPTAQGRRVPLDQQPVIGLSARRHGDGRARVPHDAGDRQPRLDRGVGHVSGPRAGVAGDRRAASALGPGQHGPLERRVDGRDQPARRRARSGWRPSISGPAAAGRPPTTAGCTSR